VLINQRPVSSMHLSSAVAVCILSCAAALSQVHFDKVSNNTHLASSSSSPKSCSARKYKAVRGQLLKRERAVVQFDISECDADKFGDLCTKVLKAIQSVQRYLSAYFEFPNGLR
jgi:hypothetical protein